MKVETCKFRFHVKLNAMFLFTIMRRRRADEAVTVVKTGSDDFVKQKLSLASF